MGTSSEEDDVKKKTSGEKTEEKTISSSLFSDEDSENSDSEKKEPETKTNDGMADLFGSDYESGEEEFKASGVKESPVREQYRESSSLQDNDVPIDELRFPSNPALPTELQKNAKFFISKLPSILTLRPEAFSEESINNEVENASRDAIYRSYVRWRYKRDEEGKVICDEESGLPKRESNSKVVQWSDGSFSLHVGKDTIKVSEQTIPNSFLFVQKKSFSLNGHEETVLEGFEKVNGKLTMRPLGNSHRSAALKMRVNQDRKEVRLKEYISTNDAEADKNKREKMKEDQIRLQARKKSRDEYEQDRYRGSNRMDARFLEEGFDDIEYDDNNLSAIKEQVRSGPRHRQKKKKASTRDRRKRRDAYDSYSDASDSNESQDEEDDEEEDDGDFVVSSRSKSKKRRLVDDDDDE